MEKAVLKLLKIQSQVRVFHWQAKPEPKHRALGDYYDTIDDLIDRIVENVSGTRQQLVHLSKPEGFTLMNIPGDDGIIKFLTDVNAYLLADFWNDCSLKREEHEEIFNIIQEFMGATNKLKYLLLLGR